MKIRHLKKNKKGNDYIVKNIGGKINLLSIVLDNIGFNIKKDRLFSVGTMIGDSTSGITSLELLKNDWFYGTLCAHDARISLLNVMAINLVNIMDKFNRGYKQMPDNLKNKISNNLSNLPFLIHIEGEDKYIGSTYPRLVFENKKRRIENFLLNYYFKNKIMKNIDLNDNINENISFYSFESLSEDIEIFKIN